MTTSRWILSLFLVTGSALSPLFAEEAAKPAPLSEEAVRAAAEKIDELVEKTCKEQDVTLNALISDEVFVRRIHLDLVGRIPTADEVRDFLGSTYPAKRERLIEELLGSEGCVSHAYNYWADVLRVNEKLGNNDAANEAAYRLWIKDALRRNEPYDRFVYELVSAKGHVWDNGATGYYQRDRGMPLDNMANTVRIFLGTRLECAQCHNHPFDKWTQLDFYGMAAFSNGVGGGRYDFPNRRALSETAKREKGSSRVEMMSEVRERLEEQFGKDKAAIRTAMKEELAKMRESAEEVDKKEKKRGDEALKNVLGELYKPLRYTTVDAVDKPLKLPHDYQYDDAKPEDVVPASTMFGAEVELTEGTPKIEAYAAWMTSPQNPTFTRVIVNRLWKRLFGLALIEPFDELTENSVSTNPELLAYLEELMKDLQFDMRAFTRILASTEAYQRAATTEEIEPGTPYYFQGPLLRRLSAEQVWDSALTMLIEDPDRYKPSVKQDIARIETQKQIYESLEGRPFEEYREMVERLAETLGEQSRAAEEKRKEALAARAAGDEEKARELTREVRSLQSDIERTVKREAFEKANRGADEAALFKVFGITEAVATESVFEPARLETPKKALPEGLSKQERRALIKSRAAEVSKRKEKGNKRGGKTGELGTLARASEITARPGSFLRTFGQSDREVIENASEEATVPQALELLNGPVAIALTNPGSVLGKELQEASTPEAKIETLYTAMLARKPSAGETDRLLKEINDRGEEAYDDIVWAVLNGSQFLFIQ
ncbi:MAG: DUF1549 domain-containing protein [Verrucomicrobiae bacterium]|nr:DUF1549 domain-containing protein [Verrucomicrobiae bacterium]